MVYHRYDGIPVVAHPYLFLYERCLGFSIHIEKVRQIENPVEASTWSQGGTNPDMTAVSGYWGMVLTAHCYRAVPILI